MNKKLFGTLLLGSILVRVSPTNAELTADNRDAKAVYPLVQGQKLTIKLDQSDMSAGMAQMLTMRLHSLLLRQSTMRLRML